MYSPICQKIKKSYTSTFPSSSQIFKMKNAALWLNHLYFYSMVQCCCYTKIVNSQSASTKNGKKIRWLWNFYGEKRKLVSDHRTKKCRSMYFAFATLAQQRATKEEATLMVDKKEIGIV